jgi:hypothetical protein
LDINKHEAGFDAWCTGRVFLAVVALAENEIPPPSSGFSGVDEFQTNGGTAESYEEYEANFDENGEMVDEPAEEHKLPETPDPLVVWKSPKWHALANYVNVNGTMEGSLLLTKE